MSAIIQESVRETLRESICVQQALLDDAATLRLVVRAGRAFAAALRRGNEILLFGNGGGAADAQHIATAKTKGLLTVGLTGKNGNAPAELADFCFCVPSASTPRIQEGHTLIGQKICDITESLLAVPQPKRKRNSNKR